MTLFADGLPRPDHGPGWANRVCRACAATWVGHVTDGPDWCPWCEEAAAAQVDNERHRLLHPPWLQTSTGDPRYDELGDVDRAVWDRTRGQAQGTDSVLGWVARLRRAVEAELITPDEAARAMRRIAPR